MQIYNAIPHLVVPVVTDPKKVMLACAGSLTKWKSGYAS